MPVAETSGEKAPIGLTGTVRAESAGKNRENHGETYAIWAPAQCPVRIGYPPWVLAQILRQFPNNEGRGSLFGIRNEDQLQVFSTDASPAEGLEPVGIFVIRRRGEVFLTDADLEFLETSGAPMALVIAGKSAGFFVWEPRKRDSRGAGSRCIRSIRSYLEFTIPDAPAEKKSSVIAAAFRKLTSRTLMSVFRDWRKGFARTGAPAISE